MANIYHNITGVNSEVLLQTKEDIKSIYFTPISTSKLFLSVFINYDASVSDNEAKVDDGVSYKETGEERYYIIRLVRLQPGATFILEEEDLIYDLKFKLVVQLTKVDGGDPTPEVDLVIRNKSNAQYLEKPYQSPVRKGAKPFKDSANVILDDKYTSGSC